MNPLALYSGLQTASDLGGLYRAGTAFKAAPGLGSGLGVAQGLVGVIGVDRVVGALVKVGVKLATGALRVDKSSAEEMVALMRSRVPVDTGRLLNGIGYEMDGNMAVVTASAASPTGRKRGAGEGADYARFVEFGTKGGERGRVADSDFFETADGGRRPRRRRARRTHPGTPARPYFWNSAREVLEKRGQRLEDVIGEAASAEGF